MMKMEKDKFILDARITRQKKLNLEQMISNCTKEYLLKKGYTMENIIKNDIKDKDLEDSIKSCCVGGNLCIPKMQIIKNLVLTQEAQKRMGEIIKEQQTEEYFVKEEVSEEKKEEIENKIDKLNEQFRKRLEKISLEKDLEKRLKLEKENEELSFKIMSLNADLEEKFEEALVIERGFVVCVDNKGKYKISRICEGEANAMELDICRKECKDNEYKVIGSFHIHPNNIMIPSSGDLRTSQDHNENVIFVGGMAYGKPVVNAFYLKENVTWKDVFGFDLGQLLVGGVPFLAEIRPRVTYEHEMDVEKYNPIRKIKYDVPEPINEEDLKEEWEHENEEKLKNLSKKEIGDLWEEGKYDFMGENEIDRGDYHEEEYEFYSDEDLEKINEKGKKIFSKYFNVVTLEL